MYGGVRRTAEEESEDGLPGGGVQLEGCVHGEGDEEDELDGDAEVVVAARLSHDETAGYASDCD